MQFHEAHPSIVFDRCVIHPISIDKNFNHMMVVISGHPWTPSSSRVHQFCFNAPSSCRDLSRSTLSLCLASGRPPQYLRTRYIVGGHHDKRDDRLVDIDRQTTRPIKTRPFVSVPVPLFYSMTVSIRDVALPTDEVPTWVQGNQIGMGLNVILFTLVVYATRTSQRTHSFLHIRDLTAY